MPGRTSSIRRCRNTERIDEPCGFRPVCQAHLIRSKRFNGMLCLEAVETAWASKFRYNHRAEAAMLIRFLYGRSDFVRTGNTVPLR